jgi:hypothetical protein
MKLKLICLIVALIAFCQAASPNKTFRCAGIPATPATILIADDTDFVPSHYLNKI